VNLVWCENTVRRPLSYWFIVGRGCSVVHRYSGGRVSFFAFEVLWRWRFTSPCSRVRVRLRFIIHWIIGVYCKVIREYSGAEGYKNFGFERGREFLFFLDNINEIKFLTCIRKCFDTQIRDCLWSFSKTARVSTTPRISRISSAICQKPLHHRGSPPFSLPCLRDGTSKS
jgi:hypothetical protein